MATAESSSATDQANKAAYRTRSASGCLILFTLPFLGAGLLSIATGVQSLKDGTPQAGLVILVGTLFAGISIFMITVAIRGNRSAKAGALKQSEHPDQPWLWNPEWAAGEIRSKAGTAVTAAGFFAVFWNAISWTIAIKVMDEFSKTGDKKALLVLIFPGIGLLLLAWFCYALLQHLKYGVAKFRMLSVPGVLGGTLRGAIEVPVQINPPEGFKVRLVCVRRVSTGSGKNRSTSETVKWEDEKIIRKDLLEHDRTRTGIPVFFNIPFDLPEPESGNPAIIWRLTVAAEVPGIDFAATFSVPVFKTAESREDGERLPDPTVDYQPDDGEYRWPTDSPILLTDRGGSLEAYFPPARNKGTLLFLFIFCAIWNGVIVFMLQAKVPLLFLIVFGFFDLIVLAAFLGMLCRSVRVEASSMGLKIHSRFIISTGTQSLRSDELSHIGLRQGMSSGDKVWYDLWAVRIDKKRHSLGGGIPGKRQAVWLAQRIADRVGVDFQE